MKKALNVFNSYFDANYTLIRRVFFSIMVMIFVVSMFAAVSALSLDDNGFSFTGANSNGAPDYPTNCPNPTPVTGNTLPEDWFGPWNGLGAGDIRPDKLPNLQNCQQTGYLKIDLDDNKLNSGWYYKNDFSVYVWNEGDTFAWVSNIPVYYVYAKGGSLGGNLYTYDPPSKKDCGLSQPGGGWSHITFYYCEPIAEDKGSLEVNKEFVFGDAVGFNFDISQITVRIVGPSYPHPGETFSIDIDTDGKGSRTWSNLLPGEYTVTEESLGAEWEVEVDPTSANVAADSTVTVDITNTYIVGTGCLKVIKVWQEAPEWYDDFPESITVNITGPNEYENTVTLKEADDWEFLLCGLAPGKYFVEEDPVDSWISDTPEGGFEVDVVAGEEAEAAEVTITNSFEHCCMKLIKQFEAPDGIEFPLDEIEVKVKGIDVEFEETYYLKAEDGWEKIICVPQGLYEIEEITEAEGWFVTYNPESREIEVVPGEEPGPEATLTITNTYIPDRPAISVKKYVSVDGGTTWVDADDPTGPQAVVGSEVQFKFVVTNRGNATLTDITLTDSKFDLSGFTLPDELEPGEFFERVLTGVNAEEGQHANEATATGKHEEQVVDDKDKAHYSGVVPAEPSILLDKSASPSTYSEVDQLITYTYIVTNNGGVVLNDVMLIELAAEFTGSGTLPDPAFVSSSLGSPEGTLQPGEFATYTATYSITTDDITAGSVYNKAEVTAKDPNEEEVKDDDDDIVTYVEPGTPAIRVKKFVSVDGGSTWYDAETASGPSVLAGNPVRFRFEITNVGTVPLTNITLSDNWFDLSNVPMTTLLNPGSSFEYVLTGVSAVLGQHSNTATATGDYEEQTVTDTDMAHYFGYTPTTVAPSITVKKYVSIDGGSTWLDAETAPGPTVLTGSAVQFRFVITNTGNVTLTDITLTDSVFNLTGVSLPASLAPGASFTYILTGVNAIQGQHSNRATATGRYGGQTYSDFDLAHYFGQTPITVIVEEPEEPAVEPEPVIVEPEEPAVEPEEPVEEPEQVIVEPEEPETVPLLPRTDGHLLGFVYALWLLILASIALEKGFKPQIVSARRYR